MIFRLFFLERARSHDVPLSLSPSGKNPARCLSHVNYKITYMISWENIMESREDQTPRHLTETYVSRGINSIQVGFSRRRDIKSNDLDHLLLTNRKRQ